MNITIKKFSKELAPDFFDFFDNRAFSDGSPYYPCYCDAYFLTPEEVIYNTDARARELGGTKEALRQALKESAKRLIDEGTMQGYLAYDKSTAIGWCNAGEKAKYTRAGDLNPACRCDGDIYFENVIPGEVFSIICFEIAPEYRGMGIAKALLNHAVKDAKEAGYKAAEGYPKVKDGFSAHDFTGPMGLYLGAGFYEAYRTEKTAVMRKDLR